MNASALGRAACAFGQKQAHGSVGVIVEHPDQADRIGAFGASVSVRKLPPVMMLRAVRPASANPAFAGSITCGKSKRVQLYPLHGAAHGGEERAGAATDSRSVSMPLQIQHAQRLFSDEGLAFGHERGVRVAAVPGST